MSAHRRDPIVILTGPPAAGKTATARLLTDGAEPAVQLEADRFFQFIGAGYVEPWRPESHRQNEAVMGIVARAAAGYADAGYFTVIDGIVMPRWFYEPLRDDLLESGHAVAYGVLRPPLAVCADRAASRNVREAVDPDVFARLWREFDQLGDLERHVIDTDGLTPRDAAEVVIQRLREGALNA